MLEIGCGTGETAIRLAPGVAHWTATDFSTERIRIAQAKIAGKNVVLAVADAVQAFDGGPFGAVCAFNMLHLVDNLLDTLARIHANLMPGGELIYKTWCFLDVDLKLRLLFPMLRLFGLFPIINMLRASDLRQDIRDAGFDITEERIFGDYRQNPHIIGC